MVDGLQWMPSLFWICAVVCITGLVLYGEWSFVGCAVKHDITLACLRQFGATVNTKSTLANGWPGPEWRRSCIEDNGAGYAIMKAPAITMKNIHDIEKLDGEPEIGNMPDNVEEVVP
jgi:hypothetical protein